MKMMEETAQGMFASTIVYEVPPYQRSYVWEKADQWQPLWNDLTIRAKSVANGGEPTHFMGAVVLLRPKADQRAGGTRIVVDGQQRLVTVQILCLAVEKALRARGLAEAADRIATMIPRGTREQDWKIAPSLGDKAAFRKAMAAGNEGHEGLVRAKRYFREECDGWLESVTALAEERGNALSRVLCQGLTFGVIVLEDEETQYAVFETLNARGTELTQSDLAKNHIVEIWRRRTRGWPSEAELQSVWPFEGLEYKGKTDRGRRALPKSDEMLRHWLCARMAMEVRRGEICKMLKTVLREQFDDDVVAMGKVLNRVAERWARWTAQDTWEAPSGSPAERIRAAETWAWGPVLMALDERENGGPERETRALRVLEAYIVRRKLAGLGTQGANTLAVSIVRALGKSEDKEAATVLRETLSAQDADSRRWASKEEVERGMEEKGIYSKGDRRWARVVLEAMEGHLRHAHDDKADGTSASVEHIYPLNGARHWGSVDEKEEEERSRLVNTAGNLILVEPPLNSSLGNLGWGEKRKKIAEHASRKVTREMLEHATGEWGASAIRARSRRMAGWAEEIWPITKA